MHIIDNAKQNSEVEKVITIMREKERKNGKTKKIKKRR